MDKLYHTGTYYRSGRIYKHCEENDIPILYTDTYRSGFYSLLTEEEAVVYTLCIGEKPRLITEDMKRQYDQIQTLLR